MLEHIAAIIGAIGTISAITFALLSARRTDKQDTEAKATSIAVLNSDLGYVKSGIDDIKKKQDHSDSMLNDLTVKVSEAENTAKSAHHRLDMHEARIVKLEHESDS